MKKGLKIEEPVSPKVASFRDSFAVESDVRSERANETMDQRI